MVAEIQPDKRTPLFSLKNSQGYEYFPRVKKYLFYICDNCLYMPLNTSLLHKTRGLKTNTWLLFEPFSTNPKFKSIHKKYQLTQEFSAAIKIYPIEYHIRNCFLFGSSQVSQSIYGRQYEFINGTIKHDLLNVNSSPTSIVLEEMCAYFLKHSS